jgi:predicted nuclease of predicted toxin-antitoxin system
VKIVIDACLATGWVEYLRAEGFDAVHWRDVGEPSAPDEEIVEWALVNGAVILTHDLDFGAILAVRELTKPSVVCIRDDGPVPGDMGKHVLAALASYGARISEGAIVTVYVGRSRITQLPLR